MASLRSAWVLAVCLSTTAVFAQDVSVEILELRARLDELEARNQELQKLLQISSRHPNSRIATPANWEQDAVQPVWEPPDERSFIESGYPPPHQYHEYPEHDENPLAMTASWNHGLLLSTKDKAFRLHIGGRTQFDTSWYSVDPDVQRNINIPYGDGVDFRRARLRAAGTMYEFIDFAVEYDFVNSIRARDASGRDTTDFDVTALTDMWWTFTGLPVLGNVRVGNQKEAIGFEHLVSSRWLPFMERSFNQDAFYGGLFNGFTPGISAFNNYADERGMWQIGLYKPTDNVFAFNTNTGDYAVTGRLTYLPIDQAESGELLHVGASSRLGTTVNDRARFRTRDAVRSGVSVTWPVPADTGELFAENNHFLNFELVGVNGPWTFQSEYLYSFLPDARTMPRGPEVGTFTYHGGYVQLLYYLTGESDSAYYNRKTAVFERISPFENFLISRREGLRGIGGWQVGARYNYLDLNDQGVNGGRLNNLTAGLNWFLNPNMKIQFNYSATDRDAPLIADRGDGWIHGYGIRFAHDF